MLLGKRQINGGQKAGVQQPQGEKLAGTATHWDRVPTGTPSDQLSFTASELACR
jgi:hypothetical protein